MPDDHTVPLTEEALRDALRMVADAPPPPPTFVPELDFRRTIIEAEAAGVEPSAMFPLPIIVSPRALAWYERRQAGRYAAAEALAELDDAMRRLAVQFVLSPDD